MALSPKHQEFVNEYLLCWNQTEAYKRVYPKSSDDAARAHAARLVADGNIAAEIQRRIDERAMSADEVLTRLAEHARGNMNDFVRFDDRGNPTFDLQAASVDGKLQLAKKLKTKTRSWSEPYFNNTTDDIEQREVTETAIEFELYDAQAALVHIGKHHKLFADRTEISGPGGGPLEVSIVKGYATITPDDWDTSSADKDSTDSNL